MDYLVLHGLVNFYSGIYLDPLNEISNKTSIPRTTLQGVLKGLLTLTREAFLWIKELYDDINILVKE